MKCLKIMGYEVIMSMNLSVLIPTRERLNLTIKCIESIHRNSLQFENIYIYLCDNYSKFSQERYNAISRLIEDKLISYYSYDTEVSTLNVFPKIIIHERWNHMMHLYELMQQRFNPQDENYYMLCDNDMLFGPGWDEYFITASKYIDENLSKVHFIVKWPGGIWRGKLNDKPDPRTKKYTLRNKFGHQFFNLYTADFGGSSGIWFMSPKMIKKFRWNSASIAKAHGRFKTHDTGAWRQIKKSHGNIHYVAAVAPANKENPLILHLGDVIGGSICNKLEKHKRDDIPGVSAKDNLIADMSVDELFNQYKNQCYMW